MEIFHEKEIPTSIPEGMNLDAPGFIDSAEIQSLVTMCGFCNIKDYCRDRQCQLRRLLATEEVHPSTTRPVLQLEDMIYTVDSGALQRMMVFLLHRPQKDLLL